MTTPLFVETEGYSALEVLLQGVSGESNGTRLLVHDESVDIAVSSTAPKTWDPSTNAMIVKEAARHPLIKWKSAQYAFVPGPACFGSLVTLHVGWVPPGQAKPKDKAEFQALPGYTVSVCGGVGDPQFNRGWADIPFSSTRHRIIVSQALKTTGPMQLAWWVDVQDISQAGTAKTKGTGAYFFLRVNGVVEVFGDLY